MTVTVKQMVENSIAKSRLDSRRQREELREMQLDFYEENQFCKDEYLKKWGFEEKKSLPLFSLRFTKAVIQRTAMVFKTPARRYLVDEAGNELDAPGFDKFRDENSHLHTAMKNLEYMQKLLGNVVIRIEYDPEAKRYNYWVETHYRPEFSDTNNRVPIGYHFPMPINTDNPLASGRVEWWYMSADEFYIHDGRGTDDKRAHPNFPDMRNPYGILPVIDYSPYPLTDYWSLGAKSLVECNRMVLITLLDIFHGIHLQMFDQLYVKGIRKPALEKDEKARPQLKISTETAWDLGEDGEAGKIGFEPKIAEAAAYVLDFVNFILNDYGLEAQYKDQANPFSGFALIVKNQALIEQRAGDIDDIYRPKERELFNIIKALDSYHGTGYNIPDSARMRTDFAEPEFPVEPDEQRKQAEWEFNEGISTPAEYYMQQNPDIDLEEAKKAIQENKAYNNVTRSRSLGLFNAITGGGTGEGGAQ